MTAERTPRWRLKSHTDGPGVWLLMRDETEVGTMSLHIDDVPGITQFADAAVAAFDRLEEVLAADREARYRLTGWPNRKTYDAQVAVVRDLCKTCPPSVAQDVENAWARAGYRHPLTPDQMEEWHDTALGLLLVATAQDTAA